MIAANTSAVLSIGPVEIPSRRAQIDDSSVSTVMLELEASARLIRGVMIYSEPARGFAGYDLPWKE